MPLWQLFYQLFQASFFFINCFIKHLSVFHPLTKKPPQQTTIDTSPLAMDDIVRVCYGLHCPFQGHCKSNEYFQAPSPSTHWLKKKKVFVLFTLIYILY